MCCMCSRVGKALNEDILDFDLELPAAPMSERSAPFLEAISKQSQIDQVGSCLKSLSIAFREYTI